MTIVQVPGFLSLAISIVVFFAGASLNKVIPLLGRLTLPEAVTGGLVAGMATLGLHEAAGLAV